jgi:uncharacterized protein YndB with AHSA1/START domain
MTDTRDRVHVEIDQQPPQATLTEVAGRWVLTMTRTLRHPTERVWQYLTEPQLLGKWSPVVPDRPLTSVGPATSRETPQQDRVDAEVLVSDAPRELVHRWGGHLLRWTLAPTPTGSRLTLEHTFDERAEYGSFGGGWHICLAVLTTVLDGYEIERVVGSRALDYGWAQLKDRYEAGTRAPTAWIETASDTVDGDG